MRVRNKELRQRRNRKEKHVKELIKDLKAGKKPASKDDSKSKETKKSAAKKPAAKKPAHRRKQEM